MSIVFVRMYNVVLHINLFGKYRGIRLWQFWDVRNIACTISEAVYSHGLLFLKYNSLVSICLGSTTPRHFSLWERCGWERRRGKREELISLHWVSWYDEKHSVEMSDKKTIQCFRERKRMERSWYIWNPTNNKYSSALQVKDSVWQSRCHPNNLNRIVSYSTTVLIMAI